MNVTASAAFAVDGGENILLTCTTDIDTPDSYEWYKDDKKNASATERTFNIGNKATANGEYRCLAVKDNDKSAKSAGMMISFKCKH